MDIKDILYLIATSIVIIIPIGKWLVIAPLKNFIKEQTYPIQPNSNGGKSLPDIAAAVARIETRLDEHMHFHSKDN